MRSVMIALAAVSGLGAAIATTSTPAAAAEYPYCMQGKDAGYPGDCQYRSYAECNATASGRGEDCAINPRLAYVGSRIAPGDKSTNRQQDPNRA